MEQPDTYLASHHRRLIQVVAGLVVLGAASLLVGSRLEWHRWTLPYWNQVPLWLWKVLSASAEGWGVATLTAFALFQKRTLAWWAGWIVTIASSSLLPGVIKRLWFARFPRPWEVLQHQLPPLPGVEPAHWFSFPSGHTAAASALAFYWAWTHPRMAVGIAMLFWACGVGCSRMALHMHWWIDVVGGLALGATLASLGLLLSRAVVYLYAVKNESLNTGKS